MEKLVLTSIIALTLILVPSFVSAQGTQQQNKVQDPTTHESGTPTPASNQVTNQNQGEETQLQVATQYMEQLMDMEGINEGVGNQVRTLAQEQVQAQTQIQTQINKLESKSNLMKKLFGPDYGAIKNLKQQTEQNRSRIQQLTQLQNQVTDQADETQLEEAIQALVEQNTNLEEQILAEEQVGSIFGWLVRLFYR